MSYSQTARAAPYLTQPWPQATPLTQLRLGRPATVQDGERPAKGTPWRRQVPLDSEKRVHARPITPVGAGAPRLSGIALHPQLNHHDRKDVHPVVRDCRHCPPHAGMVGGLQELRRWQELSQARNCYSTSSLPASARATRLGRLTLIFVRRVTGGRCKQDESPSPRPSHTCWVLSPFGR